ncbi:MAG TPA: glycosyltransferase, partial [Acidimicrobiales bacterium]|nr:glycosyltransferase [Acidimicrobiales bacterium]
MIPRNAHFVFGLQEQHEPFHFVHYLAVESCLRVLQPEIIYFHHRHLPWGPWWDRIAPEVRLVEVDLVDEVTEADYSSGLVPATYRYAHHADFIRLDALIEHGGVYADVDTVFVRPFPRELFQQPFVIGAEPPVRDERTGIPSPSLCNAVLMAEPGSAFARAWRTRMAGALNGTWSNHSGFLSERLSHEMPGQVHVEPPGTFFSFGGDRAGLAALFEQRHPVPSGALSIHLWAHLWWSRERRDFSMAHAGWCTPSVVRRARTTFADLARPYLSADGPSAGRTPASGSEGRAPGWLYLSLDEAGGYGTAAERCRGALEASGLELDWTPLVPGGDWGLGYAPPPALDPLDLPDRGKGQVVVAHLVPEYLPVVRERAPEALVVGHTAWETDRIPGHWGPCLDAADLVVVPSTFSAVALGSSGISTPVAVVPHVVAQDAPGPPASWGEIDPGLFVFYTIAEWNERKAVFHAVEAYLRAFTARDPVVLVVKTTHWDRRLPPPAGRHPVEPGTSAWALARILARHDDPPPVVLVTRYLGENEIRGLHRRGDCFVSLCRSEGWGLGAFDAAAAGNPVVTTAYGGHLDYLAGSPFLVGYDLVPVEDATGGASYTPDQRWAEPDLDHGAELLREVLARGPEAATRAAERAEEIRQRYRPEAVAHAFRTAVASVAAERGVRSCSREARALPRPGAPPPPWG